MSMLCYRDDNPTQQKGAFAEVGSLLSQLLDWGIAEYAIHCHESGALSSDEKNQYQFPPVIHSYLRRFSFSP